MNRIPRKVAEGSAEGVVSAEGSRKGGVLETIRYIMDAQHAGNRFGERICAEGPRKGCGSSAEGDG